MIRCAMRHRDELYRGRNVATKSQTCRAAAPPRRRSRLPAPFVPQAAWLRSTAARDNDACGFPRPFHSRIRPSRPLQATRPALRPEGSHLSQVAGPPSLFFSADPVQRTILAEGAARQRRGRGPYEQLASFRAGYTVADWKVTYAGRDPN